jgi:hypothetical protein
MIKYPPTTAGEKRRRAPGGGRKPKAPGEKIESRQIRVHTRTFAKLATASLRTGRPVTEIVGELVDSMPVPNPRQVQTPQHNPKADFRP